MAARDHDLLTAARVAAADGPVPMTRFRHVDIGLDCDGSGDPVLYVAFVSFQAEPFQPGAFVTGTVDPATGALHDLVVRVVEHPLDRDSSYEAAGGLVDDLVAHLDQPHLDRRDELGTPVDVGERDPVGQVLPRVVIANPQTARLLANLGRRLSSLYTGPELDDEDERARRVRLQHGGHWLRELGERWRVPGQGQVVEVLGLLNDHYHVPLPQAERGHLCAVLGAIAGGAAAGWAREHEFAGPEPDVATQSGLWEDHKGLRSAVRQGRADDAARLRAGLQVRYEALAAEAARAVTAGLARLAELPLELRFADDRRTDDLRAYTSTAAWLLGHGGHRRAVLPLTRNHQTMNERETAAVWYDLRRLVSEPQLRPPLWATGEAVDGVRVGLSSGRVPTGARTPTGRAATTTVFDVELELHPGIVAPVVGDRLLWGRDSNLQVTAFVTAVDGRRVRLHADGNVAGRTRLADTAVGDPDTWVAARQPYTGRAPVPPGSRGLPATHHTPRPPQDVEPDDADAVADAILAVPVEPNGRSYT